MWYGYDIITSPIKNEPNKNEPVQQNPVGNKKCNERLSCRLFRLKTIKAMGTFSLLPYFATSKIRRAKKEQITRNSPNSASQNMVANLWPKAIHHKFSRKALGFYFIMNLLAQEIKQKHQ